MVTFGDVFNYNQKNYVYLAKTKDNLYVAQILSVENTKLVENEYNKKSKQTNQLERIKSNRVFCFVILKTQDFEKRAAHLAHPAMDDDFDLDVYTSVCQEDLEEIRKEILRDKSPVPLELKEIFSSLQI